MTGIASVLREHRVTRIGTGSTVRIDELGKGVFARIQ